MKFLRASVVVFVAAVAMLWQVAPAQADPHGLYYTAIGQQQLFFNVLAALDQADYVEQPGDAPTGDGDTSDPVFTRSEIAERLEASDIASEVERHPGLQSTVTGLAGTITRSVTVEGADLWTAYVLNQRALEEDRRKFLGELANAFCNRALGKCNGAKNEDLVFVTDPSEPAGDRAGGALAALLSGTDVHKEVTTQVHKDNIISGGGTVVPHDSSVARLWASAGDDEIKQAFVASAVESAFAALYGTPVSDVFSDAETTNGGLGLKDYSSPQERTLLARLVRPFAGNTALAQNDEPALGDQIIGTLNRVIPFGARMYERAMAGRDEVAEYQDYAIGEDGSRASSRLAVAGTRDENGEPQAAGLEARINEPPYVQPALVTAQGQALVAGDVPQDANLGDEPGTTVTEDTGLEIDWHDMEGCYDPFGSSHDITFKITNNSDKMPRGIVWLTKSGRSTDRFDADRGSTQPTATSVEPKLIRWEKIEVPPGGEEIFTVTDRSVGVANDDPIVLHTYNAVFFHTGTVINGQGVHRTVSLTLDRGPCTAVEGARTRDGQRSGDVLSGQVLQSRSQGGSNDNDGLETRDYLVAPHEEKLLNRALRALLGEEDEEDARRRLRQVSNGG